MFLSWGQTATAVIVVLTSSLVWRVSRMTSNTEWRKSYRKASKLTAMTRFSGIALAPPLRKVPGPLLAKITGKWLVLVDLAGNRTSAIDKLHKQYGPAVRIGPNEVSFSGIECVKEIYGQQTVYMKAPVYETFSLEPLGIFSLRDKAKHSQRRRLLSHAFSLGNLYDTEPLIMDLVDKLRLHVQSRIGKPVNVLDLFRMIALDIVGELFLGQSFDALESDHLPPYLQDADNHFLLSGIDANFPWIYNALSYIPVFSVKNFLASRERLAEYGQKAFKSYITRYGRDSKRKDLLTKILSTDSNKEPPMTDLETSMEISNLIFAGTDTTSTTLTYVFWELARNTEWQKRLRSELISSKSTSYKDLVDLPVLDAVVNESLRLHPAAPASLPRIVPQGGKELSSYYLPQDTIVSMQCYTTQRDPKAFPNPERFDPARWLVTGGPSDEMKELFMPFSKGTRACLGKNLALMELKLVTAMLVERYAVSVAPGTTEDGMIMMDHFLALPKAGRCDLIFSSSQKG